MITLAIDLGNNRIKMKSKKAEYNYPASFLKQFTPVSSISNELNEGDDNFELDNDEEFIWSENITDTGEGKVINTFSRSNRLKMKITRRLILFSIGKLIKDFSSNDVSSVDVHLILGISTKDLKSTSNIENSIKKLLVGYHKIKINNIWYQFNIPTNDDIVITSQYIGTLYNLAYDDNLNKQLEYYNGNTGIIDVGGGTILISSSNNLKSSWHNTSEYFDGIYNLIRNVSHKINTTKYLEIENTIINGASTGKYVYNPAHNLASSIDITEVITKELENYTRYILSPLISESLPDIDNMHKILITGGGSIIIPKNILQEELGEDYFSHIEFVKEPVLSNVRGLFKLISLIEIKQKEHINSNKTQGQNSEAINTETVQDSEAINTETVQDSEAINTETVQDSEAINTETVQDSEAINTETVQDSEAINTETVQDSEAINTETVQDSEAINTETVQDSEAINTETVQDSEAINTETVQDSEAINTETVQDSEAMNTETVQNSEAMNTETVQDSEAMNTETVQDSEAINTETVQDSEAINTETVQDSEAMNTETVQNSEAMNTETVQDSEAMNTETVQDSEVLNYESNDLYGTENELSSTQDCRYLIDAIKSELNILDRDI